MPAGQSVMMVETMMITMMMVTMNGNGDEDSGGSRDDESDIVNK